MMKVWADFLPDVGLEKVRGDLRILIAEEQRLVDWLRQVRMKLADAEAVLLTKASRDYTFEEMARAKVAWALALAKEIGDGMAVPNGQADF